MRFLKVGWIRPNGEFVPIELTHSEIMTKKEEQEFGKDPEFRSMLEKYGQTEDDDFTMQFDEYIAQNFIQRGWIRVQQHGFDGTRKGLVQQKDAIEDLISKSGAPLDSEVTIDINDDGRYESFRTTVKEIYDEGLPNLIMSELDRAYMIRRRPCTGGLEIERTKIPKVRKYWRKQK